MEGFQYSGYLGVLLPIVCGSAFGSLLFRILHILGGSWVVISGVISHRIWVIIIVTLFIAHL